MIDHVGISRGFNRKALEEKRPVISRKMIMAGHQPNYLPWLGYFDKMKKCDVFVIEDAVQFEYHGYTNRNRIKTRGGATWLTVPVRAPARRQHINQVEIANDSDPKWRRRHWRTLQANYGKAPHWNEYNRFFEDTYKRTWEKLTDLNMHLIGGLMRFLNIKTRLVLASTLDVEGKKSELIIRQCKALDADTYLSGAGGKAYIDIQEFKDAGLKVVFQDFKYPVYKQLHGDYIPNLSVVDYLFCTGAKER
ncbi:MAG: WbqC family protein [Candidatus Bathyarchaeia archaeon]